MNYVNVAVLVTAQLSEYLRVRPAFDKLSRIHTMAKRIDIPFPGIDYGLNIFFYWVSQTM